MLLSGGKGARRQMNEQYFPSAAAAAGCSLQTLNPDSEPAATAAKSNRVSEWRARVNRNTASIPLRISPKTGPGKSPNTGKITFHANRKGEAFSPLVSRVSRIRNWTANPDRPTASIPPRISLKTGPRKLPNTGKTTFHTYRKSGGFRIRRLSRVGKMARQSGSPQSQHTPSHLAENKTQKTAEYRQNYISRQSKKRRLSNLALESDWEMEGKSRSPHSQHTPSYVAENRTEEIAEYGQDYISHLSKKRRLSNPALEWDWEMERKSRSPHSQDTLSYLAENRTKKIAEYGQNYISYLSKKRRPSDLAHESDCEMGRKSRSPHSQHTPSHLAENRTEKIAEYGQNYISHLSRKRRPLSADPGLVGGVTKGGEIQPARGPAYPLASR